MDYSYLAVCHWAEANQGLLSFLALVATLFFACWEFFRAQNLEKAKIQDPKRIIISVFDAFLEKLEKYKKEKILIQDVWRLPQDKSNTLILEGLKIKEVINTIILSAPPSAELILSLVELKHELPRDFPQKDDVHELVWWEHWYEKNLKKAKAIIEKL